MMGFKVKEVAENMLTRSTVGSFISTKSPQTRNLPQILQKYQINRPRQVQVVIYRMHPQNLVPD